MNAETVTVLTEMGFKLGSQLSMPGDVTKLGMSLAIERLGTAVKIYCSTEGEYNTLANHGGIIYSRNALYDEAAETLVLNVPASRMFGIFRSVAVMRLLTSGKAELVRAHQSLANKIAKDWIASLPIYRSFGYLAA